MVRVEGSETLKLPREELWRRLNDPDVLGASIPGCHGFEREQDSEHRYRTSISVAIGAVKGVYDGTVAYAHIAEPERCTIEVSGRGDKGTIDGEGAIELRPDGKHTEVAYRGEFKLTGPVAGVGQRLAPGVSRKMIVETLRGLEHWERVPAGGVPESATAAPAAAETPAPSARAIPRPAAEAPPQALGRPTSRPEPEPFNPVVIPDWARFAVAMTIGLVIGFLVGRLV